MNKRLMFSAALVMALPFGKRSEKGVYHRRFVQGEGRFFG